MDARCQTVGAADGRGSRTGRVHPVGVSLLFREPMADVDGETGASAGAPGRRARPTRGDAGWIHGSIRTGSEESLDVGLGGGLLTAELRLLDDGRRDESVKP